MSSFYRAILLFHGKVDANYSSKKYGSHIASQRIFQGASCQIPNSIAAAAVMIF